MTYAFPSSPSAQSILADMELGTLGEWMGALATLAAVGISLVLALTSHMHAKHERANAAEDRHEFRRQQAEEEEHRKRRLAGQVTVVSSLSHGDWGTLRLYEVHNAADEPIFQVSIVEHRSDSEPAGSNAYLPRVVKSWNVIEARGSRHHEGQPRTFHDRAAPGEDVKPWNRSLQFDDGLGQRWSRLETGELRQLVWSEEPDSTRGDTTS
ncbi:hypothetical protein [Arthrobacter sp. AQ5-05]|uniref:hypothetical protein n=1 Tax=Arthrobacter sp. AQ5-05 TaxID=2184581 RepID=UPI0011BFBC97|nr:hypothetical protein [Arthrobacter sp. AQ5-05]